MKSLQFTITAIVLGVSHIAFGQQLQSLVTYTGPDPQYCNETPTGITSTFSLADVTVNAFFVINNMNPSGGDVVKLKLSNGSNWVSTTWNATANTGYSTQCFSDHTNIAQWIQPNWGTWQLQVLVNGQPVGSPAEITVIGGSAQTGILTLSGFSRSEVTVGNIPLVALGEGFQPGAVVDVNYIPDGHFVGSAPAQFASPQQLNSNLSVGFPGEYSITIRNLDGSVSEPRTLFVGLSGYKLPYQAGETWETTQGNDETGSGFDHHGSIAYAYDFSDGSGHLVSAMKGGIVHIHDNGILGPRINSDDSCQAGVEYGNYITVDTQDGTYSYYAHLTTGTFKVSEGQQVSQGQVLATVGNTGCVRSTGGGGYHVHVHINSGSQGHEYIYSQSLPFLFDDVDSRSPTGSPPGQPVRPQLYQSQNVVPAGSTGTNNGLLFGIDATVGAQQWWNANFNVPPHTSNIRITLSWPGSSNLVLYAASSTHSYGYGSDVLGNPNYYLHNPQVFDISQPQAGMWTVWVLGWIIPSGTQGFSVEVTN